MSDSPNTNNDLQVLQERADKLNISYRANTTAETLRKKIAEVLDAEEPKANDKKLSKKAKAKAEAAKLVRINVTCMNPAKKDWPGEIFTAGNNLLGTYRKYVPFNLENGYHVPQIIYNMLKERQFQSFYTEKTKQGISVRRSKLVREFAIEVLDPLTPEELADLAKEQAARGSVG